MYKTNKELDDRLQLTYPEDIEGLNHNERIRLRARRSKSREVFNGYSVCFKGHNKTLEQLFGKKRIDTEEMTGKLWKYMQKHELVRLK